MNCIIGTLVLAHALSLPTPLRDDDTDNAPVRWTHVSSIAWSPSGRELVFATDRGYEKVTDLRGRSPAARYLWRVRSDGTGLRQITFPDGPVHYSDSNARWSPDGRTIVFDSDRDPTDTAQGTARLRQIHLCDADGGNLRQITDAANGRSNREPCWSPDGRRLAWVTIGFNRTGIAVADAGGKEIAWVRVTPRHVPGRRDCDSVLPWDPCWTADGKFLVYRTTRMGDPPKGHKPVVAPAGLSICPVPAEASTDEARLRVLATFEDDFGLGGGTCSPVGQDVAFVCRDEGYADLWLCPLDGSGQRRLTDLRSLRLSARQRVCPAWSPDGAVIAFAAQSGRSLPPGTYEDGIWLYRLSDGEIKEIPMPPPGPL